jgi:hypothetical protein
MHLAVPSSVFVRADTINLSVLRTFQPLASRRGVETLRQLGLDNIRTPLFNCKLSPYSKSSTILSRSVFAVLESGEVEALSHVQSARSEK